MKQTFLGLLLAILLSISLSSTCSAAAPYRLTIKDGFLAVWDCEDKIWTEITDTPAAALPSADRTLLKGGIACTEQELQILLEDYCS